MFRRRASRSDDDPCGQQLVDEIEAFLAGRLAEVLEAADRPVPPWVWLNRIAHGSLAEVRRTAAEWQRVGADSTWRRARTFLAGEVLDQAPLPVNLRRLQHDVLVPLELQLATDCPLAMRSQQLVSLVLTAIARHPSAPPGLPNRTV